MMHYSGTLSFDETAGGEQTLIEQALTKKTRLEGIFIDMSNVTQIDVYVRLYYKIDGSNYRCIGTWYNENSTSNSFNLLNIRWDVYAAAENAFLVPTSGYLSLCSDFKITLETAGAGGGGSVNVPYDIPYDDLLEESHFNDAVYVDYDNGSALPTGLGTPTRPLDTLAEGDTVAGLNNLNKIYVRFGTSERAFAGNINKHLIGLDAPLQGSLSTQLSQNMIYENIKIKSTEDIRYSYFKNCSPYSNIYPKGCYFENCRHFSAAVVYPYQDQIEVFKKSVFCYGNVMSLSLKQAGGAVFLFDCEGDLTIQSMTVAANIYIHNFRGKLTLAGTNTAGTISIWDMKGEMTDLATAGGATVTIKQQLPQHTASALEDILELMYARLAGRHQFGNTGAGDNHIQMLIYDYLETSLKKTLDIMTPAGLDNTQTLDTNAIARQEEA